MPLKLLRAFADALNGCKVLITTQPNARIHLAATAIVVALGFWLMVSRDDWCWLVAAIAIVWTAEGFNTAIETLADRVTTERDPLIGRAKDLAAGAVLLATLAAVCIGLLRLGPALLARLS